MHGQINLPFDSDGWIGLKQLGSKIVFRAVSIDKDKKRFSEPSGHKVDQAVAEGSVKVRPKLYDISNYPTS